MTNLNYRYGLIIYIFLLTCCTTIIVSSSAINNIPYNPRYNDVEVIAEVLEDWDNNTTKSSSENLLESPESIQEMIELILNNTSREIRAEGQPDVTLITFLQKAVQSYGQKKVAKSIYELAQRDLYDLIWMLAGELDTYLIFDLYNAYSAAQSDPQVLSVYQRFRMGNVNRTIVPEVFALDKKYDMFSWYSRVRGRMLNSVNKYMAGQLDISGMGGNTPPPIQYDKDGKVIFAGIRIPDSSTVSSLRSRTTKDPYHYELEKDSDEDIFEFLNLDLD